VLLAFAAITLLWPVIRRARDDRREAAAPA
jgi:hypothetical protein